MIDLEFIQRLIKVFDDSGVDSLELDARRHPGTAGEDSAISEYSRYRDSQRPRASGIAD